MSLVLFLRFFAESVPFALVPLSGVRVSSRPRVSAAGLVAAVPRSLVAALPGRTRTDAVTVGLACRPAAAVRSAVVEREPAADLRRPTQLMLLVVAVVRGQRVGVPRHRRPRRRRQSGSA